MWSFDVVTTACTNTKVGFICTHTHFLYMHTCARVYVRVVHKRVWM